MRSLLKRYREPVFVIGLLSLSFAVFFTSAKKTAKDRELNFVERAVIRLTAPVEHALILVASGMVDAWDGYVALRSVRDENLKLRRDNVHARAVEQQNVELKLENERLRRVLDYADKQSPSRMVIAKVIASPHSHTLRIARGETDGVKQGDAVIAPEGIVGTVALAGAGYSDVQLIVNPLSAVAAVTQRTRSRSTVKGTGDVSRCKLEYALRTDDLQEGDVLVTAHAPGFFPGGLRIGHATNVRKQPTGMFLAAELIPAVDFARLDEVLVVIEQRAAGVAAASAGTIP